MNSDIIQAQLPKPLLQGIEKDADILVLNVVYLKPRKLDDGSWSPDYLYIMYRDNVTNKKSLQIITNPTTDIYVTKEEYMDDFPTQREALPLSKVDKFTVPFKEREKFLLKKLKENIRSERDTQLLNVINTSMELGKFGARKEVHKWRHAYYSDYNMEEYIMTTANLHYKPTKFKFNKSFFDIETDFKGATEMEITNGARSITSISIVFDYALDGSNKDYKPKVFSFYLRNHKKYKQQEKFEENVDRFVDKFKKKYDDQFGECDYNMIFSDSETDMIVNFFKLIHLFKPDFGAAWNFQFDILYLQKRLMYLGVPPEKVFCHPDFKNYYMHYKLDDKNKFDFKNSGDAFTALSYTKYVCQMRTYAARRKGGKDYGSNELDNIARIELKQQKHKWDKPSTTIINAIYEEYENFAEYSLVDILLLMKLERKLEDIDDVFMKGYDSGTELDKANRQTISIKNLYVLSHFEQGFVLGNNLNKDYTTPFGQEVESSGDNSEKLIGALVGDPTNLNPVGAKIFGEKKSNRLFVEAIDLDFGSMYPNIKLISNISRSTQYGRLILPKRISKLEYGLYDHLRGGEFVEDFETKDYIKLGIKWFKLKRTEKYIKEFSKFYPSRKPKLVLKKAAKLNHFFKLWSEKMANVLSKIFPDKSECILEFLIDVYRRDCQDYDAIIYNNYDDIEYQTTLLYTIDWIMEARPIMTESGTFFRRHQEGDISPGLVVIDGLLKKRKIFKNLQFEYNAKGLKDESKMYKLKQTRMKVYANSDYGASGNRGAFSYNFHCAQSVTSRGQALIALAMTTFEDFLTDTIRFYDLDELLHYCDNIINEERKFNDDEILDRDKTVEEVKQRLLIKSSQITDLNEDILDRYLSSLNTEQLNLLYYKSNLHAFIKENKYVQSLFTKFFENTTSFMNPNVYPKGTSGKMLKNLINIILEYTQYNYPYYAKIERLINNKRNSVCIIDTDSNIMTIKDLMDIISPHMDREGKIQIYAKSAKENNVKVERKMKLINTIAAILTEVITRVLAKFEVDTNIQEAVFGTLVMKNEFYFEVLSLADGKKRYMASIKMQEGYYFEEAEREVKGLDFIKVSYASEFVRKYIEDTFFDYVLNENMNIAKAIKKFMKLEDIIRTSLRSGNKEFLTDAKVKSIESYVDPMSNGPFKATYIWNKLYPDKEISLPTMVTLLKLPIKSTKDIAKLALTDKDMFDKVANVLKDPKLKTGITQIAIPVDSEIPEWMTEYIDVETIVNKNLSLAQPILETLGTKGIYKRKSDKYISNIISIG